MCRVSILAIVKESVTIVAKQSIWITAVVPTAMETATNMVILSNQYWMKIVEEMTAVARRVNVRGLVFVITGAPAHASQHSLKISQEGAHSEHFVPAQSVNRNKTKHAMRRETKPQNPKKGM